MQLAMYIRSVNGALLLAGIADFPNLGLAVADARRFAAEVLIDEARNDFPHEAHRAIVIVDASNDVVALVPFLNS